MPNYLARVAIAGAGAAGPPTPPAAVPPLLPPTSGRFGAPAAAGPLPFGQDPSGDADTSDAPPPAAIHREDAGVDGGDRPAREPSTPLSPAPAPSPAAPPLPDAGVGAAGDRAVPGIDADARGEQTPDHWPRGEPHTGGRPSPRDLLSAAGLTQIRAPRGLRPVQRNPVSDTAPPAAAPIPAAPGPAAPPPEMPRAATASVAAPPPSGGDVAGSDGRPGRERPTGGAPPPAPSSTPPPDTPPPRRALTRADGQAPAAATPTAPAASFAGTGITWESGDEPAAGREALARAVVAVAPAPRPVPPAVHPPAPPATAEPRARVTIGRLDVQVHNHPPVPPASQSAPAPAAPPAGALERHVLERFRLAP